jgi:hypothetical protein
MPQVPTGWDRPASFPPDGAVTGYGFGLAVTDEPVLGRVVGHGGGYPGFGSYMRWQPATGTGVIALANSTYARMAPLTADILNALHPVAEGVPLAPARGSSPACGLVSEPWPQTLAARDEANRLLSSSWDDETADRLFTPNVAQDSPYRDRRAAIELVRDRIGPFRPAADRAAEHDTPAHCRWWLAGEHGVVQAQILLTPERPPRVQSLTLAVPPAAGSPLRTMLDTIVAWMNGTGPAPSLPPSPDGVLSRRLKAAAAWAGECRLGPYLAGDGNASVTAELTGEHATAQLSVTIDQATGDLRQADITL